MMKRFLFLIGILGLFFGCVQVVIAGEVYLYVDTAPNASAGGTGYDAWQDAAFSAAAGGTFVNMASSVDSDNIGTTNFDIEDEVVFSFPDYGNRLHWIYWIPDESIASLSGNFTISLENIWDGDYLDFYLDYYGSTWLEPTKWIDYDADNDGTADGVIGTAGMAWWGAYGINTQEALDADIASWVTAEETWIFTAKLCGEEYSIESYRAPVPEPATMLLLGSGLIGLTGFRRKFKK